MMKIRPVFQCTRCARIRMTGHCGSCNRSTVPVCGDCGLMLDDEQHRCSPH